MKRIVLLLGYLAVASSSAQAGELYRWIDQQGKVHYGDVIPIDADQIKEKKFSDTAAPDEYLPYETRRAQQNFPVTLYVAENCAEYCNQARGLLSQRGIPYSEKMLQTREDFDTYKTLSGFDSVPALSVGKAFLKGFLAEQWNSELDTAGYPKTAPYRAPKAPATPAAPKAPTVPAEVPTDSAAQ